MCMTSRVAGEMKEESFESKREEGCGDIYLTLDDAQIAAKVLLDLVVNSGMNISGMDNEGYHISAEQDTECEEGIFLIKEKIKEEEKTAIADESIKEGNAVVKRIDVSFPL